MTEFLNEAKGLTRKSDRLFAGGDVELKVRRRSIRALIGRNVALDDAANEI